jgi:methyl-accepting chemotaxis protein
MPTIRAHAPSVRPVQGSIWGIGCNLKLSSKIALIGALVSVLLGAAFGLTNFWIRDLASSFRSFADNDQVIAFSAAEMYAQGLQTEQATRNILFNPADENAKKNYAKALKDFDAAYANAEQVSARNAEVDGTLRTILPLWQQCNDLKQQVQNLAQQGQQQQGFALLVKQETPKWREVRSLLLGLRAKATTRLQQRRHQVDGFISAVTVKSTVMFISGLVLALGLMIWFSLSLRGAMSDLIRRFQEIAQGDIDLTKRIETKRYDELGELADLFNCFLHRLHGIVEQVNLDTVKVAAAANNLYANSQEVAAAANEALGAASSVATASKQMAATSDEIANNCRTAAISSRQSTELAQSGSKVAEESTVLMNRLAVQVKEAAKTVEDLGMRSNQIGEIVHTIEDIADQTNLLALNAAIEAARAGDQGRGFAVVADEVRELAERTAGATREIGEMIHMIQQRTKDAVLAMENGVKEVETGTDGTARSGKALRDILDQINSVSLQVSQIATASEEQTSTTNEISSNLLIINNVIGKSSEKAQESVTEADNLSKLAANLQSGMEAFHT